MIGHCSATLGCVRTQHHATKVLISLSQTCSAWTNPLLDVLMISFWVNLSWKSPRPIQLTTYALISPLRSG